MYQSPQQGGYVEWSKIISTMKRRILPPIGDGAGRCTPVVATGLTEASGPALSTKLRKMRTRRIRSKGASTCIALGPLIPEMIECSPFSENFAMELDKYKLLFSITNGGIEFG